jgi:biopolymer transport protein TolQ
MTLLDTLTAATAAVGAPTRLDPVKLFLDADIVVQVVMAGLVLASIWVWAIIVSFSLRMGSVNRRSDAYESDFWEAAELDSLKVTKGDLPPARVAAAGLGEWKRSVAAKVKDRDGLRQRLQGAMDSAVANEADRLSDRLNFLATVGSVAPFVGLFGTVWGIMNSFIGIAESNTTNLAVVAPGIAEALLATGIGLFAAIPSVIFYNYFQTRISAYGARTEGFVAELLNAISRQLDKGA